MIWPLYQEWCKLQEVRKELGRKEMEDAGDDPHLGVFIQEAAQLAQAMLDEVESNLLRKAAEVVIANAEARARLG